MNFPLMNNLFEKFISVKIQIKCKFICCSKENVTIPLKLKNSVDEHKNGLRATCTYNRKVDTDSYQSSPSYRKSYSTQPSESSPCIPDDRNSLMM